MLSKLYQDDSPFTQPAECETGRQEYHRTFYKGGKLYTMTLRDKVIPEDPYLNMIKAYACQVRTGKAYPGQRVDRRYRDFLVRSNVVI